MKSHRTAQESIMKSTSKQAHGSGMKNDSSSPRQPAGAPPGTLQSRKDKDEKQQHTTSENELESAQDKNPVPPGSTRDV